MAARLVGALAARPDDSFRLAVLRRIAEQPAADSYPVFLKLLITVAESSDSRAKAVLADTLAVGLKRLDLPSGRLTSWGATRLPEADGPVSAGSLSDVFFGGAPKRMLGPLEYLTVWHSQRTQRIALTPATYRYAVTHLVELFNVNAEARRLYPAKLAADAGNEIEGVYTGFTRDRLQAMATTWLSGQPPAEVARVASETPKPASPVRGWVMRDL